MGQSKPMNGEGTPHRKFTTYQDYLAQRNITDDLPAAERIHKVANLCRAFEIGAQRLSDNLQPGEIEKRVTCHEGVPCSVKEMKIMLQEDEHVVGLIESCVADMARFQECKINGTSLEFAACSQILTEQKARLEAGKIALASLLDANDSRKLAVSLS